MDKNYPNGMDISKKVNYGIYKSYVITHRKPEHFFVKYSSFGISTEILNNKEIFSDKITKVLFIYHPKENEFSYFLVDVEKFKKGLTWNNILHDNTPDPQKHVSLNEMVEYSSIEEVPEPEQEQQPTKIHTNKKEEKLNKMVSLKEAAQAYEPRKTLNIADLDRVDLSFPIEERTGTDLEGKDFTYKVMIANNLEYRTPATVLEEIKKIVELKPETKAVKVIKTGSGLQTRYEVKYLD